MRIYFIRSEEISLQHYGAIRDLIQKHPGPAQFIASDYVVKWSDGDFTLNDQAKSLEWQTLWEKCDRFRADEKIPATTAVVLLTNHPNREDYYSAGEFSGNRNYFIQANWWKKYRWSILQIGYPEAYELAAIPLFIAAFDNYGEADRMAHRQPRGCFLDRCNDDLLDRIKFRTADICPDCRKRLTDRKTNPAMVRQVLSFFEEVREGLLYMEHFKYLKVLSHIVIDERDRTILFRDINPEPLKLTPQEMVVYAFYMNHPGGVVFSDLPNYKAELIFLYLKITSKFESGTIVSSVERMVQEPVKIIDPVITRINQKIIKKAGPRIAKEYQVIGRGKAHKIQIDRSYVSYTSHFDYDPALRLKDKT